MNSKILLLFPTMLLLAPFSSVYSANTNPIGINLDFIAPWASQIVFVDAMRAALPWVAVDVENDYAWRDDIDIPQDENGYPLQIPYIRNGREILASAFVLTNLDGHYPSGLYTLVIEGNGTIIVSGDTPERAYEGPGTYTFDVRPSDEGLFIEMVSSEIGSHISNLEILFPGYGNSIVTNQYHPFYPPFIEDLQGFDTIRQMGMLMTVDHACHNAVGNPEQSRDVNCQHTWKGRTGPNERSQSADRKGIAWEHAIDLVSHVRGANMWVNLPHAATDDYVRRLALLVRDRLPDDRSVYLELSNEVWNGSPEFIEAKTYFENIGSQNGLSGTEAYTARLLEVIEIFNSEFGQQSDRLVRVLSSQGGYAFQTETLLSHLGDERVNPHGVEIDTVAIAAYFGTQQVDPNNVPNAAQILSFANADIPVSVTQSLTETQVAVDEYAQSIGRDIPVIMYEGGGHLTPMSLVDWSYITDENTMRPFVAANRDPQMYALYQKWAKGWFDNGGGLAMPFSYMSYFPSTTIFGHREYFGQPLSSAHKMRALKDLLNQSVAVVPESIETPKEPDVVSEGQEESLTPVDLIGGDEEQEEDIVNIDKTFVPESTETPKEPDVVRWIYLFKQQ